MKQYVVDAFTDKIFAGNPAAICVMNEWLSDELMQKIAVENNLSETSFVVKEGDGYHLRWFTPGGEVKLCGHATLATSYVITHFVELDAVNITYQTLSGILKVHRNHDLYEMDFPTYPVEKIPVTDAMTELIGVKPIEAYKAGSMLLVFENEEQIKNAIPNQTAVMKIANGALNITAKGTHYDCVSRTFAPICNVPEDPVCGSAHCGIVPMWAAKYGRNDITAYQASRRGGVLYCTDMGERIIIRGKAALFAETEIYI